MATLQNLTLDPKRDKTGPVYGYLCDLRSSSIYRILVLKKNAPEVFLGALNVNHSFVLSSARHGYHFILERKP